MMPVSNARREHFVVLLGVITMVLS